MNKTIAITAVTMFAVMLGLSAFAPAMADPPGEPNPDKFLVCHIPPGNPDNARIISVGSQDSVDDHLDHGDSQVFSLDDPCPPSPPE